MPKPTPPSRDYRDEVVFRLEQQDAQNTILRQELLQTKTRVAYFTKTSGFNQVIRQVLRGFDPGHIHTEWKEDDITPLGGCPIDGHKPAFVEKPSYPDSKKTRYPGYFYQARFGPGKPSFDITAAVCIEETEIYLAVSFVVVNGLTHEACKPIVYDSREKSDLGTWLNSLCDLHSRPQTIQIVPDFHIGAQSSTNAKKRPQRIFYPD